MKGLVFKLKYHLYDMKIARMEVIMYTYIIVDDESLIRKGTIKKLEPIREIITCAGEASDGKEATQLIESLNPDIIITDMSMPEFDGMTLLSYLTDYHPKKRIIVISGYKEFEYMRHALSAKAVDYILKPFSKVELQTAVLKAIQQIKDNESRESQAIFSESEKEYAQYTLDIQMLKNLILGYQSYVQPLSSEKLNFINTTHNLVLITIHSVNAFEENMVQTFLDENGFGDLALYLQHLHDSHIGFFILFIPPESTLDYQTLCKQIVRSLTDELYITHSNFLFGVSADHSDLMHLNKAYTETIAALNSKKQGDATQLFFYGTVEDTPNTFEWNHHNEFLFRLEAGMTTEMTILLDELFDTFLTSNLSLANIKHFCFQLSDEAKRILYPYIDHASEDTVSASMQNIINSIFTLDELREYYLQFYTNISEVLKEKSIYNIDNTIDKIKIYIQRNYKKDLNTDFLASLFYLNRSYCSHLFHKVTGQKLIDYINEVRIEKAKELLVSTQKKPYQVAQSVGYHNVKYFFRIFKKYTGVSPIQYRSSKE